MDGTGALFARLQPLLDPALGARVVSYPPDRLLGYDELLAGLDVPGGHFCVVAESFSGPLGVLLTREYCDRVRGLVLAASFVRSPSPFLMRLAAALVGPLLGRRPPDVVLRAAMLGMDSDAAEVRELREALESVRPDVVAHRVRELARVDVAEDFVSSSTPTLYIAGAHDRLVSARVMKQLRRLRSDMQCCVLDAPHLVLQRAAVEAAAAVNKFLLPRAG
jgi:pimeloyl-ACP methyl ester carboxylesterase